MTLLETIALAQKNGYYFPASKELCPEDRFAELYMQLLDPLFWQALGKGLDWKDSCECGRPVGSHHMGSCLNQPPSLGWKKRMHAFVDHVIDGKLISSYFEAL